MRAQAYRPWASSTGSYAPCTVYYLCTIEARCGGGGGGHRDVGALVAAGWRDPILELR